MVALTDPAGDPFASLARNLGELEVVIGERARPAVAAVRAELDGAIAARESGDMPAALAAIRRAMERLARLGDDLDPEEGAIMRFVAERFTAALNLGRKGEAKEAIGLMRNRAGDTKDDNKNDW